MSWAASVPATSSVSVSTAPAGELGVEAAQRLGEGQVRSDRARSLGRQQRRVDGVARGSSVQHVEDLLGRLLGHQHLGLGGRCAEVRREHRVRRVQERVARSAAPSCRRRSRPRRWCRRGARAASAASSTTAPRATLRRKAVGFIRASSAAPIRPFVALRHRDVERHRVRACQQLLERDELDPVARRLLGGYERIAADHAHLEGAEPDRRSPGRSCRGPRSRASCREARGPRRRCASIRRAASRRPPRRPCGPARRGAPASARRPRWCSRSAR